MEDIKPERSFESLLKEHINAWDDIHAQVRLVVDGDPEINKALLFNNSTVLSSMHRGLTIAGPGAKEGFNPIDKPYGGRVFWDDIYCIDSLPPEYLETMVKYRYNQLDDARNKAKKYVDEFRKDTGVVDDDPYGAFFPWEAWRPGGGEGCPERLRDKNGHLVPIESLSQEIHISADVAYYVMRSFRATGNKELLRNQGAEIILEAARFFKKRATKDEKTGMYGYNGVTGPDEYHPNVKDNAFTNGMAKWTIQQAVKLYEDGMVSDETKSKIRIKGDEIERLKEFSEDIYIPFDPETLVFEQFKGWHKLEHVNLAEYPDVKSMDERLKEDFRKKHEAERKQLEAEGKQVEADKKKWENLTPEEQNPVRKTDVVKQHDAALLSNLLGLDTLALLPKTTLEALRVKFGSDEEILRQINLANYNKYYPLTCDGSSLSPNKGVEIALNAGVNPNDVYRKFKEAAEIDLKGNTHGTENGLHYAAAGGSVQAIVRGFAGIIPEKDFLTLNPRLPSHWNGLSFRSFYKGNHYEVFINNVTKKMTIELIEPKDGASMPINFRGQRLDIKNKLTLEI